MGGGGGGRRLKGSDGWKREQRREGGVCAGGVRGNGGKAVEVSRVDIRVGRLTFRIRIRLTESDLNWIHFGLSVVNGSVLWS